MEVHLPPQTRRALKRLGRLGRLRRPLPEWPEGSPGQPRILILSASTGNGHMSAAWALEREASERGCAVAVVDALDHTARGFRVWFRGGYETLVKKGPGVWGHLYRASDRPMLAYGFQTMLDFVYMSRMGSLVESFRPDWVLCTHSLPQPQLAHQRRKLGRFRIAIVVTDLYPHRMWLRGRPDHYFVPGQWTQSILEERLPHSRGRITVTGIPISRRFGEPADRAALRQGMGLDPDQPLVVVASGGIGGGPIADLVAAIGEAKTPMQAVVICGRNPRAYEDVELAIDTLPATMVTFDLKAQVPQETMADLMRCADLLVSKPGGLTTSEALASGTPFMVYTPFMIPGQEEGNARFLVEKGAGVQEGEPVAAAHRIEALVRDPVALGRMSEVALSLAQPGATKAVIDALVRL